GANDVRSSAAEVPLRLWQELIDECEDGAPPLRLALWIVECAELDLPAADLAEGTEQLHAGDQPGVHPRGALDQQHPLAAVGVPSGHAHRQAQLVVRLPVVRVVREHVAERPLRLLVVLQVQVAETAAVAAAKPPRALI